MTGCFVEGMLKPAVCIGNEFKCPFCFQVSYIGEYECCLCYQTCHKGFPAPDNCPIREMEVEK